MDITINQIQNLQKYIITSGKNMDKVLANSISKLYNREVKKLNGLINTLQSQIEIFEKDYKLKTLEFIIKYESGILGDNIDFVEWSSAIDMLNQAKKKLEILQNKLYE